VSFNSWTNEELGITEGFATSGLDFEQVYTPFLVYTEGAFSASFANIRWVPKGAQAPDARKCRDLVD
jgi:beta-glucosidase